MLNFSLHDQYIIKDTVGENNASHLPELGIAELQNTLTCITASIGGLHCFHVGVQKKICSYSLHKNGS